jgi:putative FmdB family regulatory protein
MPTYEYECKHCAHRFEAFQGITDDPLVRCPRCHRNGLRRLIGAGGGIIFRGSGFYATDYRRGPSSKGEPKAAGAKASSDKGAGGSADPSED